MIQKPTLNSRPDDMVISLSKGHIIFLSRRRVTKRKKIRNNKKKIFGYNMEKIN